MGLTWFKHYRKAEREPAVQSHHTAGCPSSLDDEFDDSDDGMGQLIPLDLDTILSSSFR